MHIFLSTLFGGVVCLPDFFLLILFIPILHCFVVQNFRELKFPVLRSCLFFLPGFLLLCVLWQYVVAIYFLFYLLFLYPSFFLTFYVVFPLFAFWPILQCPTILLVLLFFLVLPCAYASWAVHECMGEPDRSLHPQYSPK